MIPFQDVFDLITPEILLIIANLIIITLVILIYSKKECNYSMILDYEINAKFRHQISDTYIILLIVIISILLSSEIILIFYE